MKQPTEWPPSGPFPSPPARGRGLKLSDTDLTVIRSVSPPARGRGLKPELDPTTVAVLRRRPPRGGVD